VLGTNDVTPLEMADAYATFANNGVRVPPTFVTRVAKADGTVLYEHSHKQTRVFDPALNNIETEVLRQVILRGTGRGAKLDRVAAGKTGTGEEHRDAWFCGYTPDLATSVWVGFPEGQVSMVPPRTRISVFGGTWPADIWRRFMSAALSGQPQSTFPAPPALQPFASSTTTSTTLPANVVAVPSVVNLPRNAATQALEAAGLTVIPEFIPDDFSPPGFVLTQRPGPGTQVVPGTAVTIEVSAGPSAAKVPDVLGRTEADARHVIEAAGFVAVVDHAAAPNGASVMAGTVWRQDPTPASRRGAGSNVNITVQPG
jgi:penicillin-binding protein 1A